MEHDRPALVIVRVVAVDWEDRRFSQIFGSCSTTPPFHCLMAIVLRILEAVVEVGQLCCPGTNSEIRPLNSPR